MAEDDPHTGRLHAQDRHAAETTGRSAPGGSAESCLGTTGRDVGATGLLVRCPSCRESTVVGAGATLTDMVCGHCGTAFTLVSDQEASARAEDGASPPRRMVGPFELLELLGAGSFGAVWKARDTRLDRFVAVKMPRKGQLNREETEQFFREARAAAQLRHPHVVSVHEVGRDGEQVYIVSDFIEGRPLDHWLADEKPKPCDSAELCAKIADALHHAHEEGIIHRDLKPGNIMIDARGDPHLMDFGLAKRGAGEVTMTLEGQILGTPAYMSPEQARGESHQVDRRTDVYSLGVILFELLTGERPFRGNVQMLLKQIVENDAPGPRTLNGRLARDLDTICLKCLEREAQRRYRSTQEVSEELRRHLRGEAIQARPIGRPARAWRWCCRNPVIAALTITAVLLLVLVAVVATVGYVRTSEALYGEAQQRTVAQDALHEARQSESRAITSQQQAQQLAATLLVEKVDLLRRDRPSGWTWEGLKNLSEALRMGIKSADVTKLRGLASSCLIGVDLRPTATFAPGENSYCVAFSPDGKQLAIAQYKAQAYAVCKVSLASVSDGGTRSFSYSPSVSWQVKHGWVQDGGRSLAFSPDGRWLVLGTRSGWIYRWDLGLKKPAAVSWQAHDEEVYELIFSPDGKRLYSASSEHAVARWDVADGWKRAARYQGSVSMEMTLSRDGTRLVVSDKAALRWLDPITLKPLGKTVELNVGMVRYCGGDRLLAAEVDGVSLIDEEKGNIVARLTDPEFKVTHERRLRGLTASPDGSLVLSSDAAGRMKLWDVASGRLLHRVAFPGADIVRPAFSPDGRHIATTADMRVVLYELGGLDRCSTVSLQEGAVRTMTVSRDGQMLASLVSRDGYLGKVRFWHLGKGEFSGQWDVRPWFSGKEVSLSFHPSGDLLAASGDGEQLHLLRPSSSEVRAYLNADTAKSFVFGAEGRTVYGIHHGNEVVGWDPASMKEVYHWSNRMATAITGRSALNSLAAGKDWLVAGSETVGALLLRSRDGQMEGRWESPGGPITSVTMRRDDSLAAMGTHKGAVRVVHVPDGRVLADRKAHVDRVQSLSFSEDGTLLASASHDGTVCLWRVGAELVDPIVTLSFDARPVDGVCFAQQGKSLAVLLRAEGAVRLVRFDRLRAELAAIGLDW